MLWNNCCCEGNQIGPKARTWLHLCTCMCLHCKCKQKALGSPVVPTPQARASIHFYRCTYDLQHNLFVWIVVAIAMDSMIGCEVGRWMLLQAFMFAAYRYVFQSTLGQDLSQVGIIDDTSPGSLLQHIQSRLERREFHEKWIRNYEDARNNKIHLWVRNVASSCLHT